MKTNPESNSRNADLFPCFVETQISFWSKDVSLILETEMQGSAEILKLINYKTQGFQADLMLELGTHF